MKIKTLIIAAALFAFTPALASAQSYEYLGREGKAMAAGEMFWKWLKGDDKKDEKPVVKSPSEKKKVSSAGKAKASQSVPYYLMGREGKMMALGEALQRKKNEADTKNNNGRKSEKQIIAEELAAIPAAVKTKYDSMAKSKAFGALVAEVKSFKPSASKNYYAEKYYILQAVVKVNGKGLASVGSLQVANAILTTTDKNSYSYKEAAKVKKAIENSGKAL
ncbi:hypothetical protein [Candidatus Proelusimicrobium excrementi]|uniref:hypothetical protein n=1 Tax=Candidatus Proelusimicrobium excrementi TaxID=3416222 RepID=UPI003CA5C9C2|nr:hypothetical protein [Elusimicrobiaceae bacterium]